MRMGQESGVLGGNDSYFGVGLKAEACTIALVKAVWGVEHVPGRTLFRVCS